MAYEALKNYSERSMTFRFVSNVDSTDFAEAVQDLDPAETLFIISSKLSQPLTMTNARTARDWSMADLGVTKRRRQAFCRRVDKCQGGGEVLALIRPTCSGSGLVGGRYSMDSAIGLSTMIAIGRDKLPRHVGRLSPDGRALPHNFL